MSSAAADVRRVAAALRTLPQTWVRDTLRALDKSTKQTLSAHIGNDRRLSNFAGGSATLKTKSKQHGERVVVGEFEAGKPRAPWFWLEHGTKAHTLGGRYKGAMHPGSSAKKTWTKITTDPVDEAMKNADRLFDEATDG